MPRGQARTRDDGDVATRACADQGSPLIRWYRRGSLDACPAVAIEDSQSGACVRAVTSKKARARSSKSASGFAARLIGRIYPSKKWPNLTNGRDWLARRASAAIRKLGSATTTISSCCGSGCSRRRDSAKGKVVLDVGAGEGLVGFGALELVGADRAGHLLGYLGATGGIHPRCGQGWSSGSMLVRDGSRRRFDAVESESVDLVATPFGAHFTSMTARAFREFFRVLKPGRRTALFEPIDDQRMTEYSEYWRRRLG